MTTITGIVERNVCVKSGWAAIRFCLKDDEDEKLYSAAGKIINPIVGTEITMTGDWFTDPKWGKQFKVEKTSTPASMSREGVIAYLSSGFIKGIGPKLAVKIYNKFGKQTLRIIEKEPLRLTEVSGITSRIAKEIHDAHLINSAYMELVELLKPDISDNQIQKIYGIYGENSVSVLKKDPYRLIKDIDGVGFSKADMIARAMGVDEFAPIRISAAIVHCLREASYEGHCYSYAENLEANVVKLLGDGIDMNLVANEIRKLVKSGELVVDHDGAIYLKRMYIAECESANSIRRLLKAITSSQFTNRDIDKAVESIESECGFVIEASQRLAVESALKNTFSVITGGPGTGKTTIIKTIIRVWEQKYSDSTVFLAAPTGKAARRMEEVTGHKANTIHRLLEYTHDYTKPGPSFTFSKDNPLAPGLIIIDEASMLDIELASYLLQAIDERGKLILIGDIDQLPPIGPGNFFRDMVQSYKIPTVKLELSFRQKGKIATNAQRVNRGQGVHAFQQDESFRFVSAQKTQTQDIAIREYLKLVKEYGAKDTILLTPMRAKTSTGAETLNRLIQESLNPQKAGEQEISTSFKVFRAGDRVMQTVNNWRSNVANGDMGFIVSIEDGIATILFDSGVDYNMTGAKALNCLVLGYAMTVHKAQGSEYLAAVIVQGMEHSFMAQRNLLYTAMTRAREKEVLVGSAYAIGIAASKVTAITRNTKLQERI